MPGVNINEADALAARTLAAIDGRYRQVNAVPGHYAADRARIASDLAGLRQHAGCDDSSYGDPCEDSRRYMGGLRRTAGLYGVPSHYERRRNDDPR